MEYWSADARMLYCAREAMVADEKIAYSETDSGPLLLHVFRPPGPGTQPLPAMLLFFGGGWRGGTPRQFYTHSACLAAHGMIAICAEYRVESRHNSMPLDSVADGRKAVLWLLEHAGELGIDPERVVVGGGSAGGHVALASILCDRIGAPLGEAMRSVRGMVVFNPVADTTETGYGADRLGEDAESCSPLHNVREGLPPAIVFHGSGDKCISLECVQRLERAMLEKGNRCEVVVYDGETHGFFNFERNPDVYVDTMQRVIAFLRSVGMLDDVGPDDILRASVRLPEKSDFSVYLLAGQSNMAGRGEVEDQDTRPKLGLLSLDKENRWVPAMDPLHFDKPHIAGVGPGLTFGRIMAGGDLDARSFTGLVPCAFGGTPLSRWEKGADLYEGALERCRIAMQDGTLKGILWHQGECDARQQETAGTYGDRLARMVAELRADLGCGDIPFVAGRLGTFLKDHGPPQFFEIVDSQLAAVPDRIPNSACVSVEGLTPKEDDLHFDAPSARELGRRFAEALKGLTGHS
ncbi:sialate O-acetylesterase [Verrucomicrobiota bacterium]